jgi:uncharacterized protein (TIGR00369 family)
VIDEPVRGGFPDPSFFSMPGIEQVRALQRGLTPRPPISHLLGTMLTQAGPGTATAGMPAVAGLMGSPAAAAQPLVLLEMALRSAAMAGAPAGMHVDTATLAASYIRSTAVDSGSFVARARVVNSGRVFTLAEGVVEDMSGRSLIQGIASMFVRPIVPSPPPLAVGLKPVDAPVYPTPDPYARPVPAWTHDPAESFLSALQRTVRGEGPAPPWMQLFGIRMLDVGEGGVSLVMPASEWFCNLRRTIAPGVLAYLALVGLMAAPAAVTPVGQLPGVLSINFTFLRSVEPDGRELLARASLTHHADNLVVTTVEVTDGNGNSVALGQQSAVMRPFRPAREPSERAERMLATVLFTDIVGSTEQAERLGDEEWHKLLSRHHALIRSELAIFKGREIKTTGDGFLATFDSPGKALQCARAIRDGVGRLGLTVRAGLHTGECEVSGTDVAGIAVHIASRVQSLAAAGEILVSGTVRDLVAGSALPFESRGRHSLKGIEGEWPLFAVTT